MKFEKTGRTLVIAGQSELLFVSFDNGSLKITKGSWNQSNPPQACLSLGIVDTTVVTGMFKGQLYLWKSGKFHSAIPAHNGPVTAIHSREGGSKPAIQLSNILSFLIIALRQERTYIGRSRWAHYHLGHDIQELDKNRHA